MQNPTVLHILAEITPTSSSTYPLGVGANYHVSIALSLLVGSFLACLLHFRFLKSHRISAVRLKARRRKRVRLGKSFASELFFPAWWDIVGHLLFKLALPQAIYFLVTRENHVWVWPAIAGSATVVIVILYREIEHIWSPTRVLRRRYFLHRLGPLFAKGSVVIGLILRTVYVIVFLSFVTYGIHVIDPSSFHISVPKTADSLFAVHLQMNFGQVVWHSSEAITPVTTVSIALNFVARVAYLILIGVGFADFRTLRKPEKPQLRLEAQELEAIRCDTTKRADIEAGIVLIVEKLTGVDPIRVGDDLFNAVGMDSLGFMELHFTLEEYFEIRDIPDVDMMHLTTIREISELIMRLTTAPDLGNSRRSREGDSVEAL